MLPNPVYRLIEIASKWRIVRGIEISDGPLPLSPFAVCRSRLGPKLNFEEYDARHAGSRLVFFENSRSRAIEKFGGKIPGHFCGRYRRAGAGRRCRAGNPGPQG